MKALASFFAAALALSPLAAHADPIPLANVTQRVDAVTPKVVQWRRDIHANPELANSEVRTARLVAAHLRRLGIEVRERVAHTGVVGVLRGGLPGPVVALRTDMDALPVLEATGLPFASRATGTFNGASTPVTHACGHDAHIAMLMGAAEVLAGMKAQIRGTIVFIFQPAEEGPPAGQEGGAPMMIAEGALANPAPAAIFGLHVVPGVPGTVFYRPEGFMAAADQINIALHGRQTHGAWPWQGIDVISLSSAIVSELNTVAARTVDVTATPTIVTIATINGGVRYNIIPQDVTMTGTLRTFDAAQRETIKKRIEATVMNLAASYGARAEVTFRSSGAVTFNDPALSAAVLPALQEAAGAANVNAASRPTMVSEDFSAFQEKIPGVFYHLGASADGVDPSTSPPNHSPQFDVNEKVLPLGVRTHVLSAIRYLEANAQP
ncbi:MAG: amidohydrolase [Hyphomonadaceae bacterium]|nr:MAG: amidohydrolase [Caulobacteraceae bacterium]MBT9447787.1 amidohydrolase [Hyphomonadaceae bacterium]